MTVSRIQSDSVPHQWLDVAHQPVLVCLLGGFRLLRHGHPVSIRQGGKVEGLLFSLALGHDRGVPRDRLLELLWPGTEPAMAGQSLNSLTYEVHKLLGSALTGEPPVVHNASVYRLNTTAGVAVDLAWFEDLATRGDRAAHRGDRAGAIAAYSAALDLYHGDLEGADVPPAVLERERARALYLNLLARVADYCFETEQYGQCLEHARRMLESDPCREGAHRLVMRCYVRQGERSQALRQYRLCSDILKAEFDAPPEPSTRELYDRIRLAPGTI